MSIADLLQQLKKMLKAGVDPTLVVGISVYHKESPGGARFEPVTMITTESLMGKTVVVFR